VVDVDIADDRHGAGGAKWAEVASKPLECRCGNTDWTPLLLRIVGLRSAQIPGRRGDADSVREIHVGTASQETCQTSKGHFARFLLASSTEVVMAPDPVRSLCGCLITVTAFA